MTDIERDSVNEQYRRLLTENARLRAALEQIGGCDCQVAAARHGMPCGTCITCIARTALEQVQP